MASADGVKLRPATLEDVPGLTAVFMECFNDEYFQKVFPPGGPGEKYMDIAWANFIKSKELKMQEAQVSVLEDEKGTIISGLLLWIVRPEDGGLWTWSRRWPEGGEGMSKDLLEEFFSDMETQHRSVMKERPHCYLEIVLTHPAHRGKGHASALVRHANDVADEKDDELYLDSEGTAMSIYKRAGYIHREDVKRTSEILYPMMRPKKSERAGQ